MDFPQGLSVGQPTGIFLFGDLNMGRPPWFKFFPENWISSSSVRLLSLEEKGLFIDMICRSWQENPPGTLPTSIETLARLLGEDRRKVSRMLAGSLGDLWPKIDGRLVNHKIADIAQELEEKHFKQSEGGKKGAEARWGSHPEANGIIDVDVDVDVDKRKNLRNVAGSDKSTPAKSSKNIPKLTDEEWLKTLSDNPAWKHIDVSHELAKMDSWIAVNPKRKKTRRFITNWLNRIEKPMGPSGNGHPDKLTPTQRAIENVRREYYPDTP